MITYQNQIFAQNAYPISIPQSFTRSFNSLPTLKKGSFFGLILTRSPVFGLRPVYPSYSFTKNEHNPRISTRSPLARASAILLKKMSTTTAASDLDRSVASFNAWISSSLFMRSALLLYTLCGEWKVGILGKIDLILKLCQEFD
jgi:hypothetical protein